VREAVPDGEPDPGRLSVIIEDVVAPLALRMSLPRATSERIKQALSIIGKLSHRPDSKIATRRIAFRDSFPTALELFELTAMSTGRGQELVREWRAVLARIERARETGEIAPLPPPVKRRRRRRGPRKRAVP